ncbi:hypothetical protein V1514DRAFT_287841 [Lipomyces japonicus]|uniref:uncharacterized protein n=1 Tax=Lipomyces japonicus TaxID=56871 RepID=UPI0034CE720F
MSTEKNEEKKRKREGDFEEIEVDVNAPEPLSKKELRKQKKRKASGLPEEQSNKQTDKTQENDVKLEKSKSKSKTKGSEKDKKSKQTTEFGIWIGNLSFHLTKDDIRTFFISKSADKFKGEGIKSDEITRVHTRKTQGGNNKGFAYVDFTTSKALDKAIELSEMPFEGRKVLIKNAKTENPKIGGSGHSSESKPQVPPSRVLFVGNLPFETKESDLLEKFTVGSENGKDHENGSDYTDVIKPFRVRMATFQDSGKSKGFAFIDYSSPEEASKALSLIGKTTSILGRRNIKIEFGQDRSFRWKNKTEDDQGPEEDVHDRTAKPAHEATSGGLNNEKPTQRLKRTQTRVTPGMALANSQRAKASIVPSEGKKITFDD